MLVNNTWPEASRRNGHIEIQAMSKLNGRAQKSSRISEEAESVGKNQISFAEVAVETGVHGQGNNAKPSCYCASN